jgi:hypothetical protein
VARETAPSPPEEAATDVVSRVLGATAQPTSEDGVTLVYSDGRRAALEEVTLGEGEDLRLARLRRESELQWPAPARWWWQVTINDLRGLGRVREVFPVAARACEAQGVPAPGQLPAAATLSVPDLHWLVHTMPARLLGHPGVLDRPTTVTLDNGRPTDREMTDVPPAVRDWLACAAATRAVRRLTRRRTAERHLYLTLGCVGPAAEAFEALVRGDGVPPEPPPEPASVSHLWLAPVLGSAVFLWSRPDGWRRHEPYA